MTPPARSAQDLVAAIRPHVHPGTALYSVGQYRQTVPAYLDRTLTLVGYTGELRFGLEAEPGRNSLTVDDFIRRWGADRDALAFIAPERWPGFQDRHLPGHVIAADSESVVVSRQ
jgi:hypothetical protein